MAQTRKRRLAAVGFAGGVMPTIAKLMKPELIGTTVRNAGSRARSRRASGESYIIPVSRQHVVGSRTATPV